MSLSFKKIELEDKEIFDNYYKQTPQYSAYVSFVTLFGWRKIVDYDLAFKNGEIFIKFFNKTKKRNYFFMPQNTKDSVKAAIETLLSENEIPDFYNITEKQKDIISELYGNKFSFERNRNGDNYIYTSESLAALSGKKLHSKKNKLNKFKKTYQYEYVKVDKTNVDECLSISKKWCERKCRDNSDTADFTACEEVLNNLEKLNVKCGALKCDNKIIAFSVGEKVAPDMAIIHYEKADTDYDGSYAAINNEFIINEWSDIKYINREEDMGIEGLRKAKMAYCPEFMLETYIATYNG